MEEGIKASMNLDQSPMHSNHQTVNHGPDKFTIDFKCIVPQFTPENEPILSISHRVILLDPYVAKEFLTVLGDNISNYEKKFGKIVIPESIRQANKEAKELRKQSLSTTERPMYMG